MRFLKLLSLLMIFIMTGCQVQPILETPTRLPTPQTQTAPAPQKPRISSPYPLRRSRGRQYLPSHRFRSLTATTIPCHLPLRHRRPPQLPPSSPLLSRRSSWRLMWSPDLHWLPYEDFQAHELHFYDVLKSTSCEFPAPYYYSFLPVSRLAERWPRGSPGGQPGSERPAVRDICAGQRG